MKFKRLPSYLFIIIIISISVVPQIVNSKKPAKVFELEVTPQAVKNWTFMLYFCGDSRDHYVTSSLDNSNNFVGAYQAEIIHKLQQSDLLAGSEIDLNVIALFDRPYSQSYPKGHAELMVIENNNLTKLADYGPTNMGDDQTLADFITYCKTNFPATNYALTLSDHGRGYAGVCYDYHEPHPYFEYALGDCLSVEEIESALSSGGGVDNLFIDTCLGGSFELQWQLAGEAQYVVAGETTQKGRNLYHMRDVLYNLSRNTGMTPYELALEGFKACKNPTYHPPNHHSDPIPFVWDSASFYNLDNFDYTEIVENLSLMDAFDNFSFWLFDEVTYNVTKAREIISQIRTELSQIVSVFGSGSFMVDLGDFVAKVLDHSNEFQNQANLEYYGYQLLSRLQPCYPYNNNTIVDYHNKPSYENEGFSGFSICLPNSHALYMGYLYPNLYQNLDISSETYWDDFIYNLYPPNYTLFELPEIEYYEFYLDKIDPTVHMHIFIDDAALETPIHIGYSNTRNANAGMDIEIGIEGASFLDTMIFGTTFIQIPVANIPTLSKDVSTKEIQVVINASNAASTTRDVNLTVRHIDPSGVIWEDTKISDIQLGQIISTTVTTDDTWTDWEELAPPTTKKFSGFTAEFTGFALIFTFTLVMYFSKRKRSFK